MPRTAATTAAAIGVAALLAGCTALTGPSCTDYLNATGYEKEEMALDWVVFNNLAPEGTTVPENQELIGYAIRKLDDGCTTSAGYVRLHMFKIPANP